MQLKKTSPNEKTSLDFLILKVSVSHVQIRNRINLLSVSRRFKEAVEQQNASEKISLHIIETSPSYSFDFYFRRHVKLSGMRQLCEEKFTISFEKLKKMVFFTFTHFRRFKNLKLCEIKSDTLTKKLILAMETQERTLPVEMKNFTFIVDRTISVSAHSEFCNMDRVYRLIKTLASVVQGLEIHYYNADKLKRANTSFLWDVANKCKILKRITFDAHTADSLLRFPSERSLFGVKYSRTLIVSQTNEEFLAEYRFLLASHNSQREQTVTAEPKTLRIITRSSLKKFAGYYSLRRCFDHQVQTATIENKPADSLNETEFFVKHFFWFCAQGCSIFASARLQGYKTVNVQFSAVNLTVFWINVSHYCKQTVDIHVTYQRMEGDGDDQDAFEYTFQKLENQQGQMAGLKVLGADRSNYSKHDRTITLLFRDAKLNLTLDYFTIDEGDNDNYVYEC